MKPTIAEILHYAADHCLWNGVRKCFPKHQRYASCSAIAKSCLLLGAKDQYLYIRVGLKNMGLDTDLLEFQEFKDGRKRQGARYAWLKFAALIAEEQGV